jgi:hypothetical protein
MGGKEGGDVTVGVPDGDLGTTPGSDGVPVSVAVTDSVMDALPVREGVGDRVLDTLSVPDDVKLGTAEYDTLAVGYSDSLGVGE